MRGYYHLSIKIIGRGSGKAVVASAAYRSGEVLHDERYGKTYDYTARRGIPYKCILAPDDAPSWALDREALWNHVESFEKRKDAQLAREFTLGLPHQLNRDQQIELLEEFVREQLLSRGMVVDCVIHEPNRSGDERNVHAHLMTTLRPLDGEEFSVKKDREACSQQMVQQWREAWSGIQNRAFERLGLKNDQGQTLQVDHRSYKDQELDLEPTQHMGATATAMERKGKRTDIGDKNRAISEANQIRVGRRRKAQLTSASIERKLNREREPNELGLDGPEL